MTLNITNKLYNISYVKWFELEFNHSIMTTKFEIKGFEKKKVSLTRFDGMGNESGFQFDFKEYNELFPHSGASHFTWGYGGKGPRILAKAIAYEVHGDHFTTSQEEVIYSKLTSLKQEEDFSLRYDVVNSIWL